MHARSLQLKLMVLAVLDESNVDVISVAAVMIIDREKDIVLELYLVLKETNKQLKQKPKQDMPSIAFLPSVLLTLFIHNYCVALSGLIMHYLFFHCGTSVPLRITIFFLDNW